MGGNLTSLQDLIEKKARSICPVKKIVLRGNNKSHMTSQSRKAIMKRSRLKNKANKTIYKKHRNLFIKLKKEAKKQITENVTNKAKKFWKLCKPFVNEKGFHYKQKFTKTKRGVISSKTTIENIFNNYFLNIAKSLNAPA